MSNSEIVSVLNTYLLNNPDTMTYKERVALRAALDIISGVAKTNYEVSFVVEMDDTLMSVHYTVAASSSEDACSCASRLVCTHYPNFTDYRVTDVKLLET